jgi:hypothetical protein
MTKELRSWKQGDSYCGTALEAIEFALKVDGAFETRQFLMDWSEGELEDWPEFKFKPQ